MIGSLRKKMNGRSALKIGIRDLFSNKRAAGKNRKSSLHFLFIWGKSLLKLDMKSVTFSDFWRTKSILMKFHLVLWWGEMEKLKEKVLSELCFIFKNKFLTEGNYQNDYSLFMVMMIQIFFKIGISLLPLFSKNCSLSTFLF